MPLIVELGSSVSSLFMKSLLPIVKLIRSEPEIKRVQRICRAISEETGRDTVIVGPKTMVEKLNRMLTGWANYICLGAVSKAYSAVDLHATPGAASVVMRQTP